MAQRRSSASRRSKAEREFLSEAEDILERMRVGLAEIEDQRAEDREVEPDLVNDLFRSAHSLKSLAGMFGFEPVHDLAHRLEDVLDGLRLGRVSLDSTAPALIGETVRLFATLLQAVGEPERVADAGGAIADLTARIEALTSGDAAPADLAHPGLDPSLLQSLTEYEEYRLAENLRRGRHILLVEAGFELKAFEEGLAQLSAAVRDGAELISTLPAVGEGSDSEIRFSLLAGSESSAPELVARPGLEGAGVRCLVEGRAAAGDEEHPSAPAPAPELESLRSISDTVRVDIRKLDELMNLVGELVIQRGAIGDLIGSLTARPATARAGNDLAKVYKAIDRKLRELQAAVLDVRMVPLRQVFEKLSRVARTLRRDLGKDVRLEIRGADTELDKLIVESLVDPLMHVVRNAIDHGIESEDERAAADKPVQGSVRIEALQRENHVVIEVRDDGRGLDLEALRRRAQEIGLVAAEAELADRELRELVFAPGISTRAQVTETSGRGVGMDVVRSSLTALGGMVHVDTEPGRGTTISMTLPITLAIVQSLIVLAAGQRFAIPLNAVLETLFIDAAEIQRSEGRELLNLRGDALPLRRLAGELGLGGPEPREKPYVVVVGMGDARIGLVVDEIEGQQDTVIKPIQGPVATLRGIAGATELGAQDTVLVLDISAIVEDAWRQEAA